jgi:ferritin-like metal-binding protein YciE
MNLSKDSAREFYVIGLRNIHATVHQGRTMVEAQIDRLENYPALKEKLRAHRAEKDMQLERVETILERLGESRSAFKDTAMSAVGALSSATTSIAGDEILKNCFATCGLANFEASAYQTLIVFAEAVGDSQALPPLRQSETEERAMADYIREHLGEIALHFLSLKSQDRQASH